MAVLGPCKLIGSIGWWQCLAHARTSVALFGGRPGPIRDHRYHSLVPVLGPCKLIGSIVWCQSLAHARPSVAKSGPMQGHQLHTVVPALGPYKTIGSKFGDCFGPMRDHQ